MLTRLSMYLSSPGLENSRGLGEVHGLRPTILLGKASPKQQPKGEGNKQYFSLNPTQGHPVLGTGDLLHGPRYVESEAQKTCWKAGKGRMQAGRED